MPATWSSIWAFLLAGPLIYYWMPNAKGLLIGLAAGIAPIVLTFVYSLLLKSVVEPATISLATTLFPIVYVYFRTLTLPQNSMSAVKGTSHAIEQGLYCVGFGIIWGRGEKLQPGASWFTGFIPVMLAY